MAGTKAFVAPFKEIANNHGKWLFPVKSVLVLLFIIYSYVRNSWIFEDLTCERWRRFTNSISSKFAIKEFSKDLNVSAHES